ncbi:MAG: nucleotidyl transferase AbiEii/AbiGii toxin family protein [Patescibacteria group bacterium]|jgi:hypothetical protein
MAIHPEVITARAYRLLATIGREPSLKAFYLAGGTALALQLGHRVSVDLDFFTPKHFSVPVLRKCLQSLGRYEPVLQEADTLIARVDGVKVSFFAYRYRLLFPFLKDQGVSLADRRDIACMKLDAISDRGSKKDFVDLYFLLQEYNLSKLFTLFSKKYSSVHFNTAHILKSLVYFEDAETEPMPRMLLPVPWKKIQAAIILAVRETAMVSLE